MMKPKGKNSHGRIAVSRQRPAPGITEKISDSSEFPHEWIIISASAVRHGETGMETFHLCMISIIGLVALTNEEVRAKIQQAVRPHERPPDHRKET